MVEGRATITAGLIGAQRRRLRRFHPLSARWPPAGFVTLSVLHAISTTTSSPRTSPCSQRKHSHAAHCRLFSLSCSPYISARHPHRRYIHSCFQYILARHRQVKCGEADPSNLLRPGRLATATCPVIATATRGCIALDCERLFDCSTYPTLSLSIQRNCRLLA